MLSAVAEAKVSAQSPPWSTNASPRDDRGDPVAQHVALAREDERGVARERRHGRVEGGAVGPDRLLGSRQVGTGGEPLAGVGIDGRAHEGQG